MLNTMRFMVIGFVLIVTGSMLVAAPGDLDKTFNSDGYVAADLGTSWNEPGDLAVDTQGRILVTGMSMGRLALLRYTPDGLLDSSFGTEGIIFDDLELIDASITPTTLVLDANDKILIAGIVQTEDWDRHLFIARYNADGSRDTSFGGTGFITRTGLEEAYSVKINSAGKLIVATRQAGMLDGYILMLNSDGSVDTTFGTDGSTIISMVLSEGLILTPADEILIMSHYPHVDVHEAWNFALFKLSANGVPDTNFGTDGLVVTDFDQNHDRPTALALDSNGRIIVAGITYHLKNDAKWHDEDFGIVRYNPDGTLDTSFGSGGKVRTDFAQGHDVAADVIVQPDQRLLVIGTVSASGIGNRGIIARYNTDGTLDNSFGTAGYVVDNLYGLKAGVLDQNQRLTVLASLSYQDPAYWLARYETTGSPRIELLVNGSFETAGATKKLPANWSGTNLTKDVRKCNKPESNKFFAAWGKCAMRFVGSQNEKSQLTQIINGSAINAGDLLRLSAWTSSRDKYPSNQVTAIVTYADNSQDKIILSLIPDANGYKQLAAPTYRVKGTVSQVSVSILGYNPTGKQLIDQVSLSKVAGNTSTIVIPDPAIPLP